MNIFSFFKVPTPVGSRGRLGRPIASPVTTDRLESSKLRPVTSFVSPHGTDLCVGCHKDTGIPTETHVDDRQLYMSGVGQLCWSCANG